MRWAFAVALTALVLLAGACRRDRSSTGTPGNPFTIVTSTAHASPEARQEYDVRAGLQVVRGDAKQYTGVLVVKDASAIQTVADLRGRKVAFVDRSSTTGYLLPIRTLKDAGVEVAPIFSGSHDAAMAALAAGEVDAAATFAAERPGLRVLADTGTVPNEPVFFLLGDIDRSVADPVPGGRHLVDTRSAPLDIGPS